MNKKNVIVNADDFGITRGVNKAVTELAHAGTVSSTTVMSNMPNYKDILAIKNMVGVGIHFNLTVGKPVEQPTLVPSLIAGNGEFLSYSKLITKMKLGKIAKLEVEKEFTSQIQRLIEIDIHPDHIDSHESLLKYPFFMKIMKKLAHKYNIKAVRTYSPRKFDYTRLYSLRKIVISLYLEFQKYNWKRDGFHVTNRYDSLLKLGLDYEIAIAKLKEMFNDLPDGVTEIGVHPGHCNGEEPLFGDYNEERSIELKSLASNEFKSIIKNSGAKLITFQHMVNQGEADYK